MKGKSKVLGLVLVCVGLVFMGGCADTTLSNTSSASIIIDAPVKKVFEYMTADGAALEWNPALKEMSELDITRAGGTYKWTYEVAGQLFHGDGIVTEYIPNRKEVIMSSGDIDSEWTFLWVPRQGNKTKLVIVVEYSFQIPKAAGVAKDALVDQLEKEFDDMLQNIKTKVEG